jgi:uncharacterized protein
MSPGIAIQLNVRIRCRDGAHLSAILYRPVGAPAPSPAIILMTPYGAQWHHDRAMKMAAGGYPMLSVDVRGRGNSEGDFDPLGTSHDGYDVVEWTAQQPFCDGNVAMCGSSFSGYYQWATAREFPPHLRTIVPTASPYRGIDSPARNNIFPADRLKWLTLVRGRASQDRIFADSAFWSAQYREWFKSGLPFKEFDLSLGGPFEAFREWMAHPERDSYWDSYNPTPEQYAGISLPVLTITGAYDADQPGSLAHYREHTRFASAQARTSHHLVIGPWDHAGCSAPKEAVGSLRLGPAALVDMHALHREWYAWTMQRGPKPGFLKDRVAYFVMGAERWRHCESLDAATSRSLVLHLCSTSNPVDPARAGSFDAGAPGGGPDHYVYDPRDVSHAEDESRIDPWDPVGQGILKRGTHLVYETVRFQEPFEVTGFFRLRAWIAMDQPDTDFAVSIHEVSDAGQVLRLSNDIQRARYRESPYHSKPVEPGRPLRYDFEGFTFVSRMMAKGSRLRLVFGPLDSIYWQKNYNTGGIVAEETMQRARPVTVQLYHDEARPSALFVPVGRPPRVPEQ